MILLGCERRLYLILSARARLGVPDNVDKKDMGNLKAQLRLLLVSHRMVILSASGMRLYPNLRLETL